MQLLVANSNHHFLSRSIFFNITELNVTSSVIPEATITYSYPVVVGQFGVVRNTGITSVSGAATFTLQVSFFIRNIMNNYNNIPIKMTTTVYHQPNRMYKSDIDFKVIKKFLTLANSNNYTLLLFTLTLRLSNFLSLKAGLHRRFFLLLMHAIKWIDLRIY